MKSRHVGRSLGVWLLWLTALLAAPDAGAETAIFIDAGLRCDADAGCPCGSVCEGLYCRTLPVRDTCDTDADCLPCTGRVCARGRCLQPAAGAPMCAGRMCRPCEACVDRLGCVIPEGMTCTMGDTSCGAELNCDPNTRRCVAPTPPAQCEQDSQCGPCRGNICERSRCYSPQQQGRSCQNNSSCLFCALCAGRAGCQSPETVVRQVDADCGPGFRCDSAERRCRPATEGDRCSASSDCFSFCARTLECRGGACAAVASSTRDGGGGSLDGGGSGPSVHGAGCSCRTSPAQSRGLNVAVLGVCVALAGVSARRRPKQRAKRVP